MCAVHLEQIRDTHLPRSEIFRLVDFPKKPQALVLTAAATRFAKTCLTIGVCCTSRANSWHTSAALRDFPTCDFYKTFRKISQSLVLNAAATRFVENCCTIGVCCTSRANSWHTSAALAKKLLLSSRKNIFPEPGFFGLVFFGFEFARLEFAAVGKSRLAIFLSANLQVLRSQKRYSHRSHFGSRYHKWLATRSPFFSRNAGVLRWAPSLNGSYGYSRGGRHPEPMMAIMGQTHDGHHGSGNPKTPDSVPRRGGESHPDPL